MKIDKMKLDLAMANMAYSAKELSQQCGISQVTITRITKRGSEGKTRNNRQDCKGSKCTC